MNSNFIIILFLVPAPDFVGFFSNNPTWSIGSDVNLTCNVHLNPAVMAVNLSLLTVHIDLYRNQIPLDQIQISVDTNFTYIISTQLISFGRNDSGNYTCTANITSTNVSYLTDSDSVTNSTKITTG